MERKHKEGNYHGFKMINLARETDERQCHNIMRCVHNRLLQKQSNQRIGLAGQSHQYFHLQTKEVSLMVQGQRTDFKINLLEDWSTRFRSEGIQEQGPNPW